MKHEPKYVAYYRVSTKKQGNSGLGLDAQKQQVRSYVKCDDCIISEFVEVESGKINNRIELEQAIQLAKKENATLVIAKLDRLSRNVAFLAALMDSNLNFICCDMPEANKFTLHIFAALAQQERELISSRTKAALTAKKARGENLGNAGKYLDDTARAKSIAVRVKAAKENPNNKQVIKIIKSEKAAGKTLVQMAEELNQLGFKTSRGKEFKTGTVDMLLKRIEKENVLTLNTTFQNYDK